MASLTRILQVLFVCTINLFLAISGEDALDIIRHRLIEQERTRIMQNWPSVLDLYRKRDIDHRNKTATTPPSSSTEETKSIIEQQYILLSDKWLQYLYAYNEVFGRHRESGVSDTLSRLLDAIVEEKLKNVDVIAKSSTEGFVESTVDGKSSTSNLLNFNTSTIVKDILQSLVNTPWSNVLLASFNSDTESSDKLITSVAVAPYEMTMLEIGIQNGGSLQVWNEYFHHPPYLQFKVVGVDIDKRVERIRQMYLTEKEKENIFIFICDATDHQQLVQHFRTLPFAIHDEKSEDEKGNPSTTPERAVVMFDILIDDASHRNQDVIEVFENLFQTYIKPGGTHIVEDTHSSYMNISDGVPDIVLASPRTAYDESGMTMMTFFQNMVDSLHLYHIIQEYPNTVTTTLFSLYLLNNIRSIQFEDSTIMIRKAKSPRVKKFDRILVGDIELATEFSRDGLNEKWYENITGL